MIAQELEVSLHMAFVEARQQRHEFITVEHLLLALLDNPSAAEVLRACSANIDDLRKSLSNFIKDNTPQVAGTDDAMTSRISQTFKALVKAADFEVDLADDAGNELESPAPGASGVSEASDTPPKKGEPAGGGKGLQPGFHYNIQVHLPSNGSEDVYLNIFNALRKSFQ